MGFEGRGNQEFEQRQGPCQVGLQTGASQVGQNNSNLQEFKGLETVKSASDIICINVKI